MLYPAKLNAKLRRKPLSNLFITPKKKTRERKFGSENKLFICIICDNHNTGLVRVTFAMYKVAGTNLFGQWLEEDRIISEFRQLGGNKNNYNFDINRSKLADINWSYNIFQCGSDFYVTGDWNGKENHLSKVDLPEECSSANAESNLAMVGNDYSLMLVDKKSNTMWSIDLQKENTVKKINLNVEAPLENSSKRARRESQILKVVTTNNSCLCLTVDGRVYSGVLPSLLDTSHCIGKVIDVRCGYEHFMLLTDAGRVYTWGNGR